VNGPEDQTEDRRDDPPDGRSEDPPEDGPDERRARALVDDLFRRQSGRLVAALARLLGPSHLALAEDAVQDALLAAMQAWRVDPPSDPVAWILQTAKHRAIDRIRQSARGARLAGQAVAELPVAAFDAALAEGEDAANQLTMMFAICDEALGQETQVTLILRWLCGLSPGEIARAFLVDTQTIDRRLHRGRGRLREQGNLTDVRDRATVRARKPAVLQALYLLFNEGFHGSDADNPMHPAMCSEAIRLGELLLGNEATSGPDVQALVAMFCFHAARLPARLDAEGAYLPLAEQDRARWDRSLIERGLRHLSASSGQGDLTRWHLEAGIAAEHALAPTFAATDWTRIVALYDALAVYAGSPIVALGRALAIAQLNGSEAGREALVPLAGDEKLARYHPYWAARAEIEQRSGRPALASLHYEKAIALCHSEAERLAYARRLRALEHATES
jgi:RNA polymerase sigma-70 factor (ECF subfamily)